ncbi:MAG: outer membrane protein assembly factor BamD [Deltaproteobacteria bacterium]|nr:outer membrane protein assembly factor BamD [Deltaproteobacteria bacterium]
MQSERKNLRGISSLFAIFILLLSGCSSIPLPSLPSLPWSSTAVQSNPTAEALFEEGMAYFNNKKYALAIDRFQRVKSEFPFSPQLAPAELKLAEAYYLNKQLPEAIAAFKEFQGMHPSNENIPFVVYHLGLAHLEHFTGSDRYQKMTEIAKGYFETVVKDHASSPYAAPAREKLVQCLEYLSESEFNVATFYFNDKKYPAAIDRLEGILKRYAQMPLAAKALYYLGESYRLEKNPLKAALAYEALSQHYPDDPLTKTAQLRLEELSKEKQDPLALLLKRDGRPASALESRQQAEGNRQQKELNLVAKKEVVYEEPGEGKGMFRRALDALNPFASSSGKKEDGGKKIATAKEQSGGLPARETQTGFFTSLWRGLNPFAKEDKATTEAPKDPHLVGKIDESLSRRGIDVGAQSPAARAPASDLPKVEEPAPPATDTRELVGQIDSSLKKGGKDVAELPPPPEPAPIFGRSDSQGQKPAATKTATTTSPSAKELIAGIDEALKRKGIEPQKQSEKAGTPGGVKASQPSSIPASQPYSRGKVELAPKLPQEKGPLFFETGEYHAEEKTKESEKAGKPESLEASQPSSIPASVVKGPPQVKEKPAETKVAEKKKSPDGEEEPKGALEQIKEDLGKLRDLLNPFSW